MLSHFIMIIETVEIYTVFGFFSSRHFGHFNVVGKKKPFYVSPLSVAIIVVISDNYKVLLGFWGATV